MSEASRCPASRKMWERRSKAFHEGFWVIFVGGGLLNPLKKSLARTYAGELRAAHTKLPGHAHVLENLIHAELVAKQFGMRVKH